MILTIFSHGFSVSQTRIRTNVFGNGATVLNGGGKTLSGTIGQPVVGNIANSSLNHAIGFWNQFSYSMTGIGIDPDGVRNYLFILEQNYPNPFNPTTVISYIIAQQEKVVLKVFNSFGQEVRTLVSAVQTAGNHQVEWNGCDNKGIKVSSGLYLYQIRAGDLKQIRKMLFIH